MISSVSGIGLLKRVSATAAVVLACAGAGCKSPSTPSTTSSTTTTTVPASAALVTLTPSALAFTQTPDMPPPTQQVVLSNTGTDPLVITSVVASGNYTETDNCIGSFAPNAACTINVTFANLAVGSGGSITITDNAAGSPQSVTITGPTVTSPAGVLSTSSVTFPSQAIGTPSAPQAVALLCPINGFSAPLAITSVVTVGDFAITGNNCGNSLNPGVSCQITVVFTPTASGVRTGFLSVFDNATGGAQSATLTGTGR